MKVLFAFVVLCVLQGTTAWWRTEQKDPTPDWDKLSVTWGTFSSLPITVEEAKDLGWKLNSAKCKGKQFFGNRYILNNDPAVMLLFDYKGKIAGMQTGVLKSSVLPKALPWNTEGQLYIVTVYFTDPQNICTGNRPNPKRMGDKLLLQTGLTPSTVMEVPLKQDEIKKRSVWVPGKCFWSMGMHYWYNITKEMDCEKFFPLFVMYNDGLLNAFGFVLDSHQSSSRFEHPGSSASKLTFASETRPLCLDNDNDARSSMHVFLQKRPLFNFC